ncbi:Neuropeptide FF receptor 2 [Acropora cervicornis]|uniref:Neuropeptide FF receptor 2 n=1 Tax=Acropora cervicornis TaxID=6130 RepID=A0AAD9QKA5_ACRCE|nr:Neuropeptide FF receptor 2 [Acropora cervicornis]
MAVYRWRVIINSLQPEMRHRHIFAWIVGIWLMGFLLLLPLIIVAEKDQTGGCREDWKLQQSRAYTAVLFMLQYVLPLVTIAGAYVLIANDLGKSKQRQICNAQDRFALEVRRKEDLQIIKMMGLIVILFAVCILPIQIAWLISDFGSNEHKGVGNVLLRVADIAAYLHACVNPIKRKKDDEKLTPLDIKIKQLQEKHTMVQDFKIRVWEKMLMPKRDAIIQQLKGKELKHHEILSTDEFNKERHKLVTELEEL